MLFHLLLCLNQRLQIFNNDGSEVFHSFFLLGEAKELAAEYSEGFWLLANTHRIVLTSNLLTSLRIVLEICSKSLSPCWTFPSSWNTDNMEQCSFLSENDIIYNYRSFVTHLNGWKHAKWWLNCYLSQTAWRDWQDSLCLCSKMNLFIPENDIIQALYTQLNSCSLQSVLVGVTDSHGSTTMIKVSRSHKHRAQVWGRK